MSDRVPRIWVLLVASASLVPCSPRLFAQDGDRPGQPSNSYAVSPEELGELLDRLGDGGRNLEPLKAKPLNVPAEKKHRKLYALLETPHLGAAYDGASNRTRFFVARVILVNLTPEPIILEPRRDVTLQADGQSHQLGELPDRLRYQSIRLGGRTSRLQDLQPPDTFTIPTGKAAATWIIFANLPLGQDVPNLLLRVEAGEMTSELNVNQYARRLLKLKVKRIGPHRCLALLTISGALNTVNVGALSEELETLTRNRVQRAVIRWTDTATPVDSQIVNWLKQSTAQVGRGEVSNNRMPLLPTSLRELHLARIPEDKESSARPRTSSGRVHKRDVEAVTAALARAYRILPPDELVEEIEHGHRFSRVAAITVGGGRLSSEKLPMLLRLADDDDTLIQRAALTALRHFGEPAAIEKLLAYARGDKEPLATVAVESLAASRYAAAHQALLQMLPREGTGSQKRIVSALARHPRPIWADTIYQFAKNHQSGVAVEALRALAQIGHPRLLDVLRQALEKGDRALRKAAFGILVSRTDPKSENLALEYTLDRLKTSPPTPQMSALLDRTKDQRAVPLLLMHLERSESNRTAIIGLLAKLGDRSVAETLVEKYPALDTPEKSAALEALSQLKSPDFRRLAGDALLTDESTLVRTACEGLQNDGSSEAVGLLANALESSESTTTWSYVSNALSTLATPQARSALRKALHTGEEKKRIYALNALKNLQRRSPGYIYVFQAQRSAQREQWKQAVTQFDMALKLDPQLPDAYSGRGHVLLKQNKPDEAKKDFAQALKLNPYDSLAVTGTGICLALQGKPQEAVEFVEEARDRFTNDQLFRQNASLFSYNAACVYGRALEQVLKNKSATNREKKIKTYHQKAIADLKRAVKLGFNDFDFMKKDPDLNALHDLPEFQKLSSGEDE